MSAVALAKAEAVLGGVGTHRPTAYIGRIHPRDNRSEEEIAIRKDGEPKGLGNPRGIAASLPRYAEPVSLRSALRQF